MKGCWGVRVGVPEYREQEVWDGMWWSQEIWMGMGGGLRDTGGCLGVCGVQEGARGYGRVQEGVNGSKGGMGEYGRAQGGPKGMVGYRSV